MSGGIEAAGDLATGTFWSRTAEPRAGEQPSGAHGEGLCLNCGTALIGEHCHRCGQSAHVHRTIGSIFHDLLHGVFHFEGKIWRTLPMLVLHPGALTRRYVAGERARFVSPLALFLFSVFLMFAVWSAVGPGDLAESITEGWQKSDTHLADASRKTQATLTELEKQRAAAVAAGKPVKAFDDEIAETRTNLSAIDRVATKVASKDAEKGPTSNLAWINHAIAKVRTNPGLVVYKVQSASYKFSWVLILISTPFVALMFLWKRRFGLYDHAIFVTYSIGFMTLLTIVLELLAAIGGTGWLFGMLLTFAPPIHMFAQLRGAYGLSVFSALWRTMFLLMFASIALTTFILGVVAMEVS